MKRASRRPEIAGTRGSRFTRITLLLCCTPLVAVCGDGAGSETGGTWEAVIDTAGDTITVRTLSGGAWPNAATLVAEASIGEADGADEYIIGEPQSIAVGADGTILVLDTQVPVLRAYSADGEYLRDVGRKGGGPGEYESPDGMTVLPDGRIVVRDPPNGRISVFDASGTYLEQWPLSGGFNTDRRFYVDTAGNSYVTTLLSRGRAPWEWEFGLVRYGPDGAIIDTLAAPVWDYEFAQVKASREGSSSVRAVPFTAQTTWSFSPLGYMVGGLSTEYRIDLFRPDAPVLRIEREWTPVTVQAAEADEQRRRITTGLQRQYGSWRWNGPPIPGTKPPFKDVFVSWEGDVWVALSTEGVATMSEAEARAEEQASGRVPLRFREPVAFDVFAPDGRYLGPVTVPASFRTEPEPIVRGDRVWAVTRDDLDVASVVRFRIVR